MDDRRSMVYTMTNANVNNEIISFIQGDNGLLKPMNTTSTGGSGTGKKIVDPLTSQGSLITSRNGCLLFAVNAGSNSISSFRISNNGELTLADIQPSGGSFPNSLCQFSNYLYVANAGNKQEVPSNITGFFVDINGNLSPISKSTQSLSTASAQPSCVVISPNGDQLAVSEINTNRISIYHIYSDGSLSEGKTNISLGNEPFGSCFLASGYLLVSEAGPNSLSTYEVSPRGSLKPKDISILNGQKATCWVTTSQNEKFAFTANAGSGTITTYCFNENQYLSAIENAYTTEEGAEAAPIDICLSKNNQYLYVLNGNQGTISVLRVFENGWLKRLQTVTHSNLPLLGAQGLTVR